jgi:hypothetical protein
LRITFIFSAKLGDAVSEVIFHSKSRSFGNGISLFRGDDKLLPAVAQFGPKGAPPKAEIASNLAPQF